MATNNFKPFSVGSGANVTSQSDYEALTALFTGFQAGKASSAQINKALRQGTVMASVLAQFISDATGADVLDNGNTATPLANLKLAMTKLTPGRLNGAPVVITSTGTYTPKAGTKSILVYAVGGGGAGGGTVAVSSGSASAGGGGGGGGLACGYFTSGFDSVSITIGTGGAGVVGGAATSGGVTSFGSLLSASGGSSGALGGAQSSAYFYSNGTGGNAFTGANVYSRRGLPGVIGQTFNATTSLGGAGGSSDYGQGGNNTGATLGGSYFYGQPAVGYGAGGGGGVACGGSPATKGGDGTGGIIIVWEYL